MKKGSRRFSKFLEDLSNNPQTLKFAIYLRNFYAGRIEVNKKIKTLVELMN